MIVDIATATKPTRIETRPPWTTRLKTSRPIWSVPNQLVHDGAAAKSLLDSLMPNGATSGAAKAVPP